MTTTKTIQGLTTDDVMQVYSGRPGCACGCKGEYRYNPSTMTIAKIVADRGYEIEDDRTGRSFNLRQVKRALNLLQAAERIGTQIEGGDGFFFWDDTPNRTYTVYLMPGTKAILTPEIAEGFARVEAEKKAVQQFMNELVGG